MTAQLSLWAPAERPEIARVRAAMAAHRAACEAAVPAALEALLPGPPGPDSDARYGILCGPVLTSPGQVWWQAVSVSASELLTAMRAAGLTWGPRLEPAEEDLDLAREASALLWSQLHDWSPYWRWYERQVIAALGRHARSEREIRAAARAAHLAALEARRRRGDVARRVAGAARRAGRQLRIGPESAWEGAGKRVESAR